MDKIDKIPEFDPHSQRTWPPLLNIDQASRVLNISKWTLRKWDKENKLVSLRVGTRKDRRYKKEDILKIFNMGTK
jgi:excisionase family DNA binding protein